MADGVQVKFGANISELLEGINSATDELRKFAEAVGAIYVADKAAEFVAQFGDMGEKIERATAIFGASAKDVQELQLANQLAGGSAESFTSEVDRLQQSLQRAQVPTSQQALALRAIGLSASELIGMPLPEQFNKIADAVSHFADGGNKTAIVMALMGRGGAEMIPILDKGSAGLDEMRQRAEDAGTVMTGQTVSALAEMRQSTTLLEASLKSLGGTILGTVAPSISEFDNQLAHSIGNITALIASGQIAKFTIDAIANAFETAAGYAKLFAAMLVDISTLSFGTAAKDWKQINDEIEATANEGLNDLDDQLAKARDQYKELLNQANETNKGLKQAPSLDLGGKDALKAEMEAIQAEVAAQNAYYSQEVEHINSLAKTFAIGEQQKVQMLLAAVNQREAFQVAELQQAMSLQGLSAAQYEKFQAELTKIEQKAAADRQKINDQATQEYVKEWQTSLDAITGAFNSQLRGLLAGTETWQQAFEQTLGDLVIKFIEACEQMVVKWAATGLANMFGSGPQSMLTGLFGGGINPGQAANTTALTSLTTAVTGLTAVVTGGAATTTAETTASVAQTTATATQTVATTAETAAQTASSGATGLGGFLALFGFDQGTDYVMRGGLALIHKGEAIVPEGARGSGPFTGAGMGGTNVSAPVSINVSAFDSQSVKRFFNDNSAHMLRAINDAVRRGAHLGLRAINP